MPGRIFDALQVNILTKKQYMVNVGVFRGHYETADQRSGADIDMASSLGPIGSDLGGERASVASALLREPDRRCRFAPARGRGVATFSRLEEQYRRNGVDIEKGFGVVVIGTTTCRLLSRSCGASPEAPR
jgi:hypothetical protein